MIIESCVICGNLFQKKTKDTCPSCVLKTEEAYKKLRLYLKRHKVTDLQIVSKETHIALNIIHQLLQESRVSLLAGSTATYPCKACGNGIQTGGICTKCVDEVNDFKKSLHSLSDTSEPVEDEEKPKKPAFYSRG